jgi:acyl-CoA synthetase (AMP-forming)/AMP-acid ligase II/acyl carrier protein
MISSGLIYQIILEESNNRSEAPAILSPGKETTSYRKLSRHLQSTALQLNQWGIRPADRLAVVLPNGPEMATAFLAISAVCTCAPLNPNYSLEDFKFSLEDLHIKALVTTIELDHPSRKAASDLGIPVFDLEPDMKFAGIFKLNCNIPVNEIIHEPILMEMDDVALVLHTSGTTSHPKIVPLSHRNIFHAVNNIARSNALTPNDRCLNMMPLFHVHGLVGAVAASLVSGASVICTPGFSSQHVFGWLTEFKPTWYTAVPTIHQALLDEAVRQPEVIKKVKLRFIRSCSSPLTPQLAQELETTFSIPVMEAYGMTEATHQIASNPLPPRARKFGSVGMATGTTRVSILNERGDILPAKSVGEICIQGENVIKSYENNPKANQDSFTAGWLRTGDRGYKDEDGYIFIQGRFKELINRAGEKISPREIDEALLQHPAVKQAVAFGVPHPSLGEDVAAAIVLKPGMNVTLQELRRFAANKLVDFKVPRLIVFIADIPKGTTGKIQRIGLGEKLQTELEIAKRQETSDISKPRTPEEEKLLLIWKQVFDSTPIGIRDDFFALGGDSIKAAQILMLVEKDFKVHLSLKEIFNLSTIELMAKFVQDM